MTSAQHAEGRQFNLGQMYLRVALRQHQRNARLSLRVRALWPIGADHELELHWAPPQMPIAAASARETQSRSEGSTSRSEESESTSEGSASRSEGSVSRSEESVSRSEGFCIQVRGMIIQVRAGTGQMSLYPVPEPPEPEPTPSNSSKQELQAAATRPGVVWKALVINGVVARGGQVVAGGKWGRGQGKRPLWAAKTIASALLVI